MILRYGFFGSLYRWFRYSINRERLKSDCLIITTLTIITVAVLYLYCWSFQQYIDYSGNQSNLSYKLLVQLPFLMFFIVVVSCHLFVLIFENICEFTDGNFLFVPIQKRCVFHRSLAHSQVHQFNFVL